MKPPKQDNHNHFLQGINILKYIIFCAILSCLVLLSSCGSETQELSIPDQDQIQYSLEPELHVINQAIKDDPENPVYYYKRSRFYLKQDNTVQAGKDIETALKLDNAPHEF